MFTYTSTHTYTQTESNQCKSGNNYIISLLASLKEKFTRKLSFTYNFSYFMHIRKNKRWPKKGLYVSFLAVKRLLKKKKKKIASL